MAELADAQDSGSCEPRLVEVQVLLTAPNQGLLGILQKSDSQDFHEKSSALALDFFIARSDRNATNGKV